MRSAKAVCPRMLPLAAVHTHTQTSALLLTRIIVSLAQLVAGAKAPQPAIARLAEAACKKQVCRVGARLVSNTPHWALTPAGWYTEWPLPQFGNTAGQMRT